MRKDYISISTTDEAKCLMSTEAMRNLHLSNPTGQNRPICGRIRVLCVHKSHWKNNKLISNRRNSQLLLEGMESPEYSKNKGTNKYSNSTCQSSNPIGLQKYTKTYEKPKSSNPTRKSSNSVWNGGNPQNIQKQMKNANLPIFHFTLLKF